MPLHFPETLSESSKTGSLSVDHPLCLFSCTRSGFSKQNVISVLNPSEEAIFSDLNGSITTILPLKTQIFLHSALNNQSAHYILLLSKDKTPIFIVSSLFEYDGLCLAVALPGCIETVLSYLHSIPQITVLKDPLLHDHPSFSVFDPTAFGRLQKCFGQLFTFFESPFSAPACYPDSIALFRLMKQKLTALSALFGISPRFLIPYSFEDPIRNSSVINTDLFIANALLILSAVKRYSIEDVYHIVFISVDGCPSICIHFYGMISPALEKELYRLVEPLNLRHGGYFRLLNGEDARKESEKIPGVGYILKNDNRAPLGEHILCVFSPATNDWSSYINRSPIFQLPNRFYDGF